MNEQSRSASLLRAAIGRDGPGQPTESDWNEWVELAVTERVIPLLYHVVSTRTTDLNARQREQATVMQLDAMATMVSFEHDLLEIVGVLTDHEDCRVAILKGAATSHLDYENPSLRQFGDVDLLVEDESLPRVSELLLRQGWKQAYPLPRHHERFTHAITLRNARRVEVDLHQRIAHRAIGELVPTDRLFASLAEFEIAGRRLFALSAPDRLIHASLHTVMARGAYRRLSSSADVLVLAEANAHVAQAVFARADGWGLRSLIERAIDEAYGAAHMPTNEAWVEAAESKATRRNRLVDHAYLSDHRRPISEEVAYLQALGGWRDRGQYLRGYFSTDPAYAKRNQRSGLVAQSRYLMSRLRAR